MTSVRISLALAAGISAAGTPARADLPCPVEIGRFTHRALAESSGLTASRRYAGIYWTHNDSGDTNRIFAVRESGQLIREIRIKGAKNIDWEEITAHGDHLYIADIGNNDNDRKDLRVYRVVEPNPFGKKKKVRVDAVYRFSYPDQTAFPNPADRRFDAEAIFFANDRLYLLTKHRTDTKTVLYRFPKLVPDRDLVLEKVSSFDVEGKDRPYGGMVTAAALDAEEKLLAVLTYHALFIFERPSSGDDFLSKPIKKIDFDQDQMEQCETLVWRGRSLLIGNEQRRIYCLADPLAPELAKFPPPKATPTSSAAR